MVKQGRWCARLLCAIAETAAGELALVSPDCLNDLAPASESPDLAIQPPTPQEQQQVEDWQVKPVSMLNQERQQPTGIADPAGLPETGNGISDWEAQSKQMKLAAKVAAGMKRIESPETMPKSA